MRRVTCSMAVSLDGYIVGPDGGFDWTAMDEGPRARGLFVVRLLQFAGRSRARSVPSAVVRTVT